MGKMKLGSGEPSKRISPEQKAELAYQETVRMLELNKKIEELGLGLKLLETRAPQIIETRTVETIVEKQPEIHQHIQNITENQEIDLSHLVPVERYEAEYKMFSQVTNKKLDEVSQDYNNVNQRIDEILENQQLDELKLNAISSDLKLHNNITDEKIKNLDEDFSDLHKIQDNKIEELNNNQLKYQKDSNNLFEELIDTNKHFNKINKENFEKLNKKLKIQKIINILLAVGLIISLIK